MKGQNKTNNVIGFKLFLSLSERKSGRQKKRNKTQTEVSNKSCEHKKAFVWFNLLTENLKEIGFYFFYEEVYHINFSCGVYGGFCICPRNARRVKSETRSQVDGIKRRPIRPKPKLG